MRRYVCSICGYVYEEAKGHPEGNIPAGTKWEQLPEDWVCPLCGASKEAFQQEGAGQKDEEKREERTEREEREDARELSSMEVSAICSNLARGCEKQYKPEEAERFTELARHYKKRAGKEEGKRFEDLLAIVRRDLEEDFPEANAAAQADRGAKRALVWSEKVTRILKSLLERYAKEGDAMLEGTGVYICTICGFVYVGDNPPDICPICKVPNWKFEKVEGR